MMIDRSMNANMSSLKRLRGVISEYDYRYSAATIYSKYFIETYRKQGKRLNRQALADQVNLMLRSNDIQEVSYKFFRKFKLNE